MSMKVAIVGSRPPEWANGLRSMIFMSRLMTAMDVALKELPVEDFTEVVSGGARGADKFGEWWADQNGIPTTGNRFYVTQDEWKNNPKGAGFERNTRMAEYADIAIALWDGVSGGTADMIEKMRERNKRVIVVPIDFDDPIK